jgi:hypothetical protein
MGIIGTRIKEGQGLGNRLFVYITLRAIAKDRGWDYSILDSEIMERSSAFFNLDYGVCVPEETWASTYDEKSDRLFIGNSKHDIINGVDVSGKDADLWDITSGTLIDGILQSEDYFGKYKEEIKEWLKVKPEFDDYEYSKDDLCIINIRGGEYANAPELFLRRKYWLDAMKNMRKINPSMRFMVITDDVIAARRVLPEVEAFHFDVWKDYVTIKNAKYLILSNSSFAFFSAYTSETVKMIIAPKYWARHNVSNGYWSCEQNIYDGFLYQDRKGRLFSANECRKELEIYKANNSSYRLNTPLSGFALAIGKVRAKGIKIGDLTIRAFRSLKRRLK